jgi:hypothetical protein
MIEKLKGLLILSAMALFLMLSTVAFRHMVAFPSVIPQTFA